MSVRTNYRHTQYASYLGYITQAVVNNLAPLLFLIFQDVYQIPLEKITLLVTVNFLIQLGVDLVSARFVDKIGYRPCVVAAHLFAAAGLVGLGVFPRFFPDPYGGLLLAVLLYAIGGGLIEVLVSPIVEACPTENKAAVMSLLHSFYCWGSVGVILFSTVFYALSQSGSWTALALLWAALPLCNALYFSQVPIARLTEEGESLPLRKLVSTRLFWLFAALMFAAGASELSMSQWASAFAESGLGVSKTVGDLAGPCFFRRPDGPLPGGLCQVWGAPEPAQRPDRLRNPLRGNLPAGGAGPPPGPVPAGLRPVRFFRGDLLAGDLQRGLPRLPPGRHGPCSRCWLCLGTWAAPEAPPWWVWPPASGEAS